MLFVVDFLVWRRRRRVSSVAVHLQFNEEKRRKKKNNNDDYELFTRGEKSRCARLARQLRPSRPTEARLSWAIPADWPPGLGPANAPEFQ